MKSFGNLAIVTALTVIAPSAAAGAQQTVSAATLAEPGTRVRVTAPARVSFVGTLLPSTDDSVRVAIANGSTVVLPASQLSLLERSTGMRSHAKRGGVIGFLSGAVLGGLIGAATYTPSPCDPSNHVDAYCDAAGKSKSGSTVPIAALVGGAACAFAGVLIGNTPREAWQPVPLHRDTRVGMSERGLGLRIAM